MRICSSVLIALFFVFLNMNTAKTAEKADSRDAQSRALVARGLELHAKRDYEAARKAFEAALSVDPNAYLALEYIARMADEKGDRKLALEYYARAKRVSPHSRTGALNYEMGKLYLALDDIERAETYFRLAYNQRGQRLYSSYGLGYVLYRKQNYREAERYLSEALERIGRTSDTDPSRVLIQPLNFYLGEVYARLRFDDRAVRFLKESEFGESWEIRDAAKKIHAEINRPSLILAGRFLGFYDSNVTLDDPIQVTPVRITRASSLGTSVQARVGYRTSKTQAVSIGASGGLSINDNVGTGASDADLLGANINGWIRLWNRKSLAWISTLDVDRSWRLTQNWKNFVDQISPDFALRISPGTRWIFDVGLKLSWERHANGAEFVVDQRSAFVYAPYFKAKVWSPNPSLQPGFGYRFVNARTDGTNFRSASHVVGAELEWRVVPETSIIPKLAVSVSTFPHSEFRRIESIFTAAVEAQHRFAHRFFLLGQCKTTIDRSNVAGFEYSRYVISAGMGWSY